MAAGNGNELEEEIERGTVSGRGERKEGGGCRERASEGE